MLAAMAGTTTDKPAAVPELMGLLSAKHAALNRAELGFSDDVSNIFVAVGHLTVQPPMIDLNGNDARQEHTLARLFVDLLGDIFDSRTELIHQVKPAFRNVDSIVPAQTDGATQF